MAAQHHHQRAGRADRNVEGVQNRFGPALTIFGAGEADFPQ